MNITGQCHCGAISFTALIDPAKVVACHCTDCQAFSGAPYRAVAFSTAENFHITGKAQHYVKTAASGNPRAQGFCGNCGTNLYSTEPDAPKVFGIRLGCVNERAQLEPTVQVWGNSAMPWLKNQQQVPHHQTGVASPFINS
jgi:hypothetical protein